MAGEYRTITQNGLWNRNITFGQLLALCPLLAVTGTATNGLGMGLATTAVLAMVGFAVSLLRNAITPEIRIPVFVLIIATIVTVVDMAMNAYLHDLHKVLGLFIPLIVTNCAVFGRAEAFASRQPPLKSAFDGLTMGIGFTAALVAVGAVREVLGSGTLFANASLLLGPSLSFLELTIVPDFGGFLILLLPPGGFIVLGFLLALKAMIDGKGAAPPPKDEAHERIEQVFTASSMSPGARPLYEKAGDAKEA